MKLEHINDFLNKSKLHTFYPVIFPSSKPSSTVDVSGGTVERGGVYKVYLQVMTRETHPSIALNKSHEIRKYLYENCKGAFFDGKKVITIESDTPEPLFIGEEAGLYTVSWNYTVIEG